MTNTAESRIAEGWFEKKKRAPGTRSTASSKSLIWPEDALRQVELCASDGKTPAVVLHGGRKPYDRKPYRDALVVVRLLQFTELVSDRADTPSC